MNKNMIMIALGVVGVVCIALAAYYWLTPANALLHFIPGYEPDTSKIHVTHGIAAFIVGAACFVYIWFQSGKKSMAKKSK